MQSWAWHGWHSVDVAAIFRVLIYKPGKDAHVSTAWEGEAVQLPDFIFWGSIRDLMDRYL